MDKIRVLINFDKKNGKYRNYFPDNKFIIDTRSITQIGTDNSSDSLTEYDAIILNIYNQVIFPPERVVQILNFLQLDKKLLIVILNKYSQNLPHSNVKFISDIVSHLYSGDPFHKFIKENPSGTKFIETKNSHKSIFNEYLKTRTKSWKISFIDANIQSIIPLAKNLDNDIVAFSLEDGPDISIKAHNAFVPWLDEGEQIFWDSIVDFLLNTNSDFNNVAEWVKNYSFPALDELEQKIFEKDEQIKLLEEEKLAFESKKRKFEKIRNVLLYKNGDLLKEISKEVLNDLGTNAEDGKQGREDLVFIHNDDHYLIEVKGTEKSASKTHVRQLTGHLTEYQNENEVKPKGILLINAWRKIPLEERGTGDKPIFPDDIMKLVNLSGVALMTTQQLFVMCCARLEGKFDLKAFVELLKNTQGILGGYDNIEMYKKEQSISQPSRTSP